MLPRLSNSPNSIFRISQPAKFPYREGSHGRSAAMAPFVSRPPIFRESRLSFHFPHDSPTQNMEWQLS